MPAEPLLLDKTTLLDLTGGSPGKERQTFTAYFKAPHTSNTLDQFIVPVTCDLVFMACSLSGGHAFISNGRTYNSLGASTWHTGGAIIAVCSLQAQWFGRRRYLQNDIVFMDTSLALGTADYVALVFEIIE
jgi:hypothetical protein